MLSVLHYQKCISCSEHLFLDPQTDVFQHFPTSGDILLWDIQISSPAPLYHQGHPFTRMPNKRKGKQTGKQTSFSLALLCALSLSVPSCNHKPNSHMHPWASNDNHCFSLWGQYSISLLLIFLPHYYDCPSWVIFLHISVWWGKMLSKILRVGGVLIFDVFQTMFIFKQNCVT